MNQAGDWSAYKRTCFAYIIPQIYLMMQKKDDI